MTTWINQDDLRAEIQRRRDNLKAPEKMFGAFGEGIFEESVRALDAVLAILDEDPKSIIPNPIRRINTDGCSSVMDLDKVAEEMVAKTVEQQRARIATYRTLVREGLTIPPELRDVADLLCRECGRELNGYKNRGICRYCAGEAE